MKSTKLKHKYTDAELADSFVFRTKISSKDRQSMDVDLAAARKKVQAKTSVKDQYYAELLRLRFLMEDEIRTSAFNENNSFTSFLRKYIKLSYKAYKDFALDIGLNVTELSQILNNHRAPSDNTIIRLELHSSNFIPAKIWFRLLEKERLNKLDNDMLIREREAKYVKRKLKL
jgi:hypothetical protein